MSCDCPIWRAPERMQELVGIFVKDGFVQESDAEQCYERMLRFAVERGFIPKPTFHHHWNPSAYSRQQQRTLLDEYLAYVAEGPSNSDLADKSRSMGVTKADIANWMRRYFPGHTLSQVKKRHLPSTALVLLLRDHPWQTTNELVGRTGWSITRVYGIAKQAVKRGILQNRKGRNGYIEFAATSRSIREVEAVIALGNPQPIAGPGKHHGRRSPRCVSANNGALRHQSTGNCASAKSCKVEVSQRTGRDAVGTSRSRRA